MKRQLPSLLTVLALALSLGCNTSTPAPSASDTESGNGDGDGDGDASGSESESSDTTASDSDTDDSDSWFPGHEDSGDEEPEWLSNLPGSCLDFTVFPSLPEDAGKRLTTRLTPPSYPFEVWQVSYWLQAQEVVEVCDSTLAHALSVFVVGPGPLPDTPSALMRVQEQQINAAPSNTGGRLVEFSLDPPLVLEAGESLAIAIELAADENFERGVCVRGCEMGGGVAGLDFLSTSASEPYTWQDLVSFHGIDGNLGPSAFGVAL